MKPNLATRYFGALFTEFGKELFKEDHKLLPYYTAALIYNKLENSFRNGLIDKKYKKIKYFILMMLRLEYEKKGYPIFESNKSEKYCNDLLTHIKKEENFTILLDNVLAKLNSLSIDYASNEISKSSKLVENCKEKYFK